jgi:hypothetical protein
MKNNLIGLFFLGLSLLALTPIPAQISITSNDITGYYSIGNIITSRFDTLDLGEGMYNIGVPGGGNNWNFSSVPFNAAEFQTIVDPATTPHAADFPDATVALFSEVEEEGTTGTLYTYIELGNNVFSFLGTSGSTSVEGSSITSRITNDPKEALYEFPITFGDSWSYTGKQIIETILDGSPLPTSEDNLENTNVVDAYGTITFPDGSSTDALRIKQTSITDIEIIPGFPVVDTFTTFTFITKTGSIFTIGYTGDGAAPDEGMIQGSPGWATFGMASSVVDLKAEGFRLESPQIHPVRESSLVKYTLPESENIRISLFDVQGREVKVLANGLQAAGEHTLQLDAADLSSGVYLMSLMARKAVLTQKVIVQK